MQVTKKKKKQVVQVAVCAMLPCETGSTQNCHTRPRELQSTHVRHRRPTVLLQARLKIYIPPFKKHAHSHHTEREP